MIQNSIGGNIGGNRMNLKFKSCVLFTVLCAVLTVFSNSVGATSDGVTVSEIEQVYVNMPEIRAYFSNIDESQAKKRISRHSARIERLNVLKR